MVSRTMKLSDSQINSRRIDYCHNVVVRGLRICVDYVNGSVEGIDSVVDVADGSRSNLKQFDSYGINFGKERRDRA